MTLVKICGLTDAEGAAAAARAGADLIGFVFFGASPRSVAPEQAARIAEAAPGPLRVGLFVDAEDRWIEDVLAEMPLDILQLHGGESPERCAAIRARFGLPVMRAQGIAAPADLATLAGYATACDRFLLDAKPPAGATRPGGNAQTFDWRLLAGAAIPRPWLLAGGLTPDNVAEAIRATGAPGVDVSSGVERARGVKDAGLIEAFVARAKAAQSG